MDLKQLFHAAFEKRRDASANRDPIIRLLMPSFITIMLSVACFMTASWAWFVANHSYEVTAIQSGYFEASDVTVKSGENAETVTPGAKGVWTFEATANQEYTVSMTLTGNVEGHFKVTVPNVNDSRADAPVYAVYNLSAEQANQTVGFNVHPNTSGTVKIEVSWGSATDGDPWLPSEDTPTFGYGLSTNSLALDEQSENDEPADDPPADDDPAGSNEETGTQSAETE